jgi:large subunit ribosomal protein L13e
MPRHNNVVANQHFHKDWQNRIKTWFQQPIQKKIRREKRKVKAAKLAPRPASGALRPLVHCPTQKVTYLLSACFVAVTGVFIFMEILKMNCFFVEKPLLTLSTLVVLLLYSTT